MSHTTRRLLRIAALALTLCCHPSIEAAEQPSADKDATRDALAPLQTLIGQWKGGGHPRRGSTDGAWAESADWAWKFGDRRTAIVFNSPQSKIFISGEITAGEQPEEFILVATRPDGETRERFTGSIEPDGQIVFHSDRLEPGRPAQITFRQVAAGKRLVAVYRKTTETSKRLVLLAEVGYTRKGSGFGRQQEQAECVLTGGEASIAVVFQGKTYYVCCSGCRDYFIEHPEEVLAEYRERLAERKRNAKP